MWCEARNCDIILLSTFLKKNEEYHIGLIHKLLDDDDVITIPNHNDARVFIHKNDETLCGVILLSSFGMVHIAYQTFLCGTYETESLKTLINKQRNSIFSVLGSKDDVVWFVNAMMLQEKVQNDYFVMTKEQGIFRGLLKPPVKNITVREANTHDLKDLLPMQCLYEKEEVLTNIHSFNTSVTRSCFLQALTEHLVFRCDIDDVPIAKAQTNGMGFTTWQLGGIFVLKEYRNIGIGTYITSCLVETIENVYHKRVSLFVKCKNIAAIEVYKKIGFSQKKPFRISYF